MYAFNSLELMDAHREKQSGTKQHSPVGNGAKVRLGYKQSGAERQLELRKEERNGNKAML